MGKLTLKAARVNAGLTQKQAAQKLGIAQTTLHNYESGKSMPNIAMLQRIEDAYGVEYKDLFF